MLRHTGVEMTVEVNHCHGSVGSVDGSKERQCDRMVTTKSDNSRESPALQCRARLVCICGWWAREDIVVAFLDLSKRPLVVVPSGR